jgi:hypothetical protein
LVNVRDYNVALALNKLFGDYSVDAAWIGLEQLNLTDEPRGGWFWSDGAQASYSSTIWTFAEPNNSGGDENCAEMYLNNGWCSPLLNDAECDNRLEYICEYPGTIAGQIKLFFRLTNFSLDPSLLTQLQHQPQHLRQISQLLPLQQLLQLQIQLQHFLLMLQLAYQQLSGLQAAQPPRALQHPVQAPNLHQIPLSLEEFLEALQFLFW